MESPNVVEDGKEKQTETGTAIDNETMQIDDKAGTVKFDEIAINYMLLLHSSAQVAGLSSCIARSSCEFP